MNVLVLSTWFPYPPDNGSRLRAFYLLRELAAHHRLWLVTGRQDDVPEGPLPEALTALCERITVVPWVWHQPGRTGAAGAVRALLSSVPRSVLETPNPALTAAIGKELSAGPDAVLCLQMGMDAYLPPTLGTIPAVLEEAEVSGMEQATRSAPGGSRRLQRILTQAKGTHYWRRRFRRYTALTTASDAEADAVRRIGGATSPAIVVVPNGVDTAHFATRTGPGVPGRMIYNGALSYAPNHEAVRWFVDAILPRIAARNPDAHLVVTGRASVERTAFLTGNPRVTLTGYVDDLRPVLADAQIAVVPLLSGGGTRLKILEAWAAQLPVVATRIGAAGLSGAVDGRHLQHADSADEFADACLALLGDAACRAKLGQAARALAIERYDWKPIGVGLDRVLRDVARSA
jgi:glycosyltransferase involved in cell wall biosynthesis